MERDTLRCYVDEKRCVLYVLFYLYRIVCCHLYIFAFRPNRATFSLSLSLSLVALVKMSREKFPPFVRTSRVLKLPFRTIFARRKAGAMLRVALISSWIVELASPLLRTTRTHRFLGAYLLLCYFVPELSSISDFLFGKKYHLSADMTFIRFSHRRTSDSDTRLNKRVV